jgi:hypothetical protein
MNTSLRLFQRRRLKVSLRGGYTSNLASLVLNQIVGSLSAGPGSVAPDASVLTPVRNTLANLTMNANSTFELKKGVGLFGSLDRGAILSDSSQGGPAASYFTSSGGVTWAGKMRWGNASAQYGRDFGRGSVTGQSGTIQGQNYQLSVQSGTTDTLQLNASVHGSDQSIHNEQPIDENSFAADMGIGRRVAGRWGVRVGGGWQDGSFHSVSSDFHNRGYTARVGVEHPRFQLNASINTNLGNSLPLYGQYSGQVALSAILADSVRTVPSNYRAMTFTAHANATRKLEISALWTHSLQRLDGLLANDFGLLDIRVTYHFRRIQVEAGYLSANQIFSSYLATYPETQRGRMYVRVTRPAHLL